MRPNLIRMWVIPLYGKVGKGDQLIEHLHQVNLTVRGQGAAIRPRILSDLNSRRTDRVIME